MISKIGFLRLAHPRRSGDKYSKAGTFVYRDGKLTEDLAQREVRYASLKCSFIRDLWWGKPQQSSQRPSMRIPTSVPFILKETESMSPAAELAKSQLARRRAWRSITNCYDDNTLVSSLQCSDSHSEYSIAIAEHPLVEAADLCSQLICPCIMTLKFYTQSSISNQIKLNCAGNLIWRGTSTANMATSHLWDLAVEHSSSWQHDGDIVAC